MQFFLQQLHQFTEKTSFKYTSCHQNIKPNCICMKHLGRISVNCNYFHTFKQCIKLTFARPVDVVELKYLERPLNWDSSTCASPAMIWNKTLHWIQIWNNFTIWCPHTHCWDSSACASPAMIWNKTTKFKFGTTSRYDVSTPIAEIIYIYNLKNIVTASNLTEIPNSVSDYMNTNQVTAIS